MEYLFLFITIVGVSQWVPIKNNIIRILGKKKPVEEVKDSFLTNLIAKKVGIKIESFRILKDDKPHGAMIGIPGKPIMLLSNDLYENFNRDELEYVILHEVGHYEFKHGIKIVLFITFLTLVGVATINSIGVGSDSRFITMVLGISLGIVSIQFQKTTELEADSFAVSRVSNPKGMISATKKFRKSWQKKEPNRLLRYLFYAGVPYSKRLETADKEIVKRENENNK